MADRMRIDVGHGTCRECGRDRKLQSRGLCYGCYDRRWKSGDWGPYDIIPKPRPVATYTEKRCTLCGVVKSLEEFARNKNRTDGHTSHCKPCAREKYHVPIRTRNARVAPPSEGELTCRDCDQVKPVKAFYWDRAKAEHRAECKDCVATRGRQYWRRIGRARQRERLLQGKYGISGEQYEALAAAQDGCCAICGLPPGSLPLAVDHDHVTGVVRGLLCSRCNTGIGQLRDDPRLMRLAALYVERHGQSGGESSRWPSQPEEWCQGYRLDYF